MIITIDGNAGTGKSTVAKELAQKLGYSFFDTGAMYRAFTYYLLKQEVDFHDLDKIKKLLAKFPLEISIQGSSLHYFIGTEEVTQAIRMSEVTQHVSQVSALGVVREHMVRLQRKLAEGKRVVFEGRDMGTVVFPDAYRKFFLTARSDVCAKRRYLEVKQKNLLKGPEETSLAKIKADLIARDQKDSSRENSPSKPAPDAIWIDTSDLTIAQVVETLMQYL